MNTSLETVREWQSRFLMLTIYDTGHFNGYSVLPLKISVRLRRYEVLYRFLPLRNAHY